MPATLLYRDLAVRVVAAACKLVGASGTCLVAHSEFDDQVVSAVGEAFNNIALHGGQTAAPGEVEIEIESGVDFITVRLADYGDSFDLAAVPTPNLDDLPESGMGLYIIKSFMNEVRYEAGRPNVLSLTKRLTEAA